MARTKREIIILTFIVSCVATVLSIVSMATQQWVTSDLKANIVGLDKAEVSYGLFGGTLVQRYLNSQSLTKKVAIACIFEENICGFSTGLQNSQRTSELKDILNGKSCVKEESTKKMYIQNNFNIITPQTLSVSNEIMREPKTTINGFNYEPKGTRKESTDIEYHNSEMDEIVDIELLDKSNKTDAMRYVKLKRSLNEINKDNSDEIDSSTISSTSSNPPEEDIGKCDPTFINGGLWLVTIFFLSLSIIMGALTATISVVNTAGNPISPWFNIWGLYIWNGLASIFIAVTMILWGSQFGAILIENVSVTVTLNGKYKNDTTALGFSFWMLFAPFVLHIVNIGLFKFRQHLIEKEPEISEEKIDNADRDGMIFVY